MACKDFRSLLPNASEHELALERVSREKYCTADPAVIRSLFDPMTCPVELLPWLAYALSVDVWNDRWPEQTKRAVCANSLNVHLHKGTLGGIEHALGALGVRAEIVEWWQAKPEAEPGTMEVTMWVHDNILSDAEVLIGAELTRDIVRQLDSSKRASIHYTFQLAVETEPTGVAVAMSAQLTTLQKADAHHTHIDSRASRPVGIGFAASAQLSALQRLDARHIEVVSRASQPFTMGLAMSAQLSTFMRLEARL